MNDPEHMYMRSTTNRVSSQLQILFRVVCVKCDPVCSLHWIVTGKIMLEYFQTCYNVLNISSSEIIQKVEVLDVVGRVILSKTLNSSNYILNVSNLNSNVYFINYSINGIVNTKKVIVNN
jgi:hypothetical protein